MFSTFHIHLPLHQYSFPASVAAEILSILVQRTPRHAKHEADQHIISPTFSQDVESTADNHHQLQQLYLQSTFDLQVTQGDQSHTQPSSVDKKSGCSGVVTSVMTKLMQRLAVVGNQLLETVTKEVRNNSVIT